MVWFVDVLSNTVGTASWGRVVYIGQEPACIIYILNTDHTYDQILQATTAIKMISIIDACKSHLIKNEDVKVYQDAHSDSYQAQG